MRRALVFLLIVFSALEVAFAQEPPDDTSFGDEITVALSTVTVRVVDALGNPVPDLGPGDFNVRVGGREIPVVAVDWNASDTLAPVPLTPLAPTPAPAAEVPAREPGQLVVFFVQADLNPTRISGQLRLRPYTRELLDRLHPADRVAVVSYDSHLKLWLDFTRDRDAVWAALDRAMVWSEEAAVAPAAGESLARGFDAAAARRAASPERALEVTARALIPLPGEKSLVYLGWGLGRYSSDGVRMTPAYDPAVRALARARASVFVLDVTSADFHSLEVGLQAVAEATGGTYAKTNVLPGLATDALVRTLSGFYVLTLDQSELAGVKGSLRIDLRKRKGTVLVRPARVR
jgi:VWFA-related protein